MPITTLPLSPPLPVFPVTPGGTSCSDTFKWEREDKIRKAISLATFQGCSWTENNQIWRKSAPQKIFRIQFYYLLSLYPITQNLLQVCSKGTCLTEQRRKRVYKQRVLTISQYTVIYLCDLPTLQCFSSLGVILMECNVGFQKGRLLEGLFQFLIRGSYLLCDDLLKPQNNFVYSPSPTPSQSFWPCRALRMEENSFFSSLLSWQK